MHILVAVASRHGSTREIADTIADELRLVGLSADVRDAEEVLTIDDYAGVVLGSAVYMGNWCAAARAFVERHRTELRSIPVWLFSSGPIGAPDPQPHGDPSRVAEFALATHALEHRVFAGKLDDAGLSIPERLVCRMVGAQSGDFRNWPAIRTWARDIAASMNAGDLATVPPTNVQRA
jgi:menaquinone-dependent protoporphyrinogen oxidase